MAQYQITVDGEVLHQLFLGDEGVRKLLESVLNQVLEAQVSEHLKAGPYERTDEREGYRNGYRDREMKTRVGTLELRIPRVRSGSFSTDLFSRYQRSEQALLLALMEMVINGVSTRKVRRITEELCGTSFSKSTISELCKALDPVVSGWNERSLKDKRIPFVIVDALQLKIRQEGRVVPQSALLAVGVNEEGRREVLGVMIGDSESEAVWSEFFRWLNERGLQGVDLVVSDHHGGLVNAVKRRFQGVSWQRCQVHFMRNILDACPKRHQDALKSQLRLMFNAPDMKTARNLLDDIVEEYAQKAPRAVVCLEAGFDDAMAVMALPEPYRRRLRSTNGLERLNREVRRRERVVGIFPNVDSALRLLGALLMEQDEEWTTGRLYFRMEAYWEHKSSENDNKPAEMEPKRNTAA